MQTTTGQGQRHIEITRGYFQCPDSGDEVVVKVYENRCPASCQPTSALVDASDPDTVRWCDLFNQTAPRSIREVESVLQVMRVDPVNDVNWD